MNTSKYVLGNFMFRQGRYNLVKTGWPKPKFFNSSKTKCGNSLDFSNPEVPTLFFVRFLKICPPSSATPGSYSRYSNKLCTQSDLNLLGVDNINEAHSVFIERDTLNFQNLHVELLILPSFICFMYQKIHLKIFICNTTYLQPLIYVCFFLSSECRYVRN